jgi:formylmethanofuran dehydrogenase subunit E
MNSKPPRMPSTSSYRESQASSQARSQQFKTCTKCNNQTAEPLAGVEINGRFVCARCWMKMLKPR